MARLICIIPGCYGRRIGQGLCPTHYQRKTRHGDPMACFRSPNWTAAEDGLLLDLICDCQGQPDPDRRAPDGSIPVLAAALGRTEGALTTRLKKLKRALRRQSAAAAAGQWVLTPAQVAIMRAEAATMRPAGMQRGGPSVVEALRDHETGDRPIGRPERPCARCGNKFQPTQRRRLLCLGCFSGGHSEGQSPCRMSL